MEEGEKFQKEKIRTPSLRSENLDSSLRSEIRTPSLRSENLDSSLRSEIGKPGYINENCWLAKTLNYSPAKRCQYCELKFRNCLFFQYLIISLILIIFLLTLSFLIEGEISKLVIISIFTLIIIYGYFFNKSTEKIIENYFAQRKAKKALEELAKSLESQVEQRTKELRTANERLKQLDEAKSEFLSIASHQLRTPLTTIKGVTSMLLEEFWGKLNEEQKKHLSQIYQSEERLLKLVEDLLDISRIEAGRVQFNFQPTSLEELIDGQIKDLRPLTAKKNLYLHFIKFKSPLPEVLIDAHKIEQVIQNLIDNAIKYTDAGEITITLEPIDDHLLFSIRDTGSGVPKPIQPFLFEKFQRGPRATIRYPEGAGLGLYWAGKVIKAHNGKIWVESEGENRGSIFYFTLPISKEV